MFIDDFQKNPDKLLVAFERYRFFFSDNKKVRIVKMFLYDRSLPPFLLIVKKLHEIPESIDQFRELL